MWIFVVRVVGTVVDGGKCGRPSESKRVIVVSGSSSWGVFSDGARGSFGKVVLVGGGGSEERSRSVLLVVKSCAASSRNCSGLRCRAVGAGIVRTDYVKCEIGRK